VCNAFGEIVVNTLETADRATQNITLSHRLSPEQMFALAAYQVTYNPEHSHYFEEQGLSELELERND
jgi:hypothetical protein